MHKPLEEYLAAVAKSLRPLPVARRNEELREIRQHSQSAVAVNQEKGQTKTEAEANAIEQFGTPGEVSQSIVRVWRHNTRKRQQKSYFRSAPIWLFFYVFVFFLHPHQIDLILSHFYLTLSLMLGYALMLFLPTRFTPAWLVLERGPLGLTWPQLTTACVVILCTVGLFNLPILGAKHEINPLANVILLFLSVTIFWCWRCEAVAKELRQDQENGNETLGVA